MAKAEQKSSAAPMLAAGTKPGDCVAIACYVNNSEGKTPAQYCMTVRSIEGDVSRFDTVVWTDWLNRDLNHQQMSVPAGCLRNAVPVWPPGYVIGGQEHDEDD